MSESLPRSRSNSVSQPAEPDETSSISTSSNATSAPKASSDFSSLPSNIEIHPQNATLTSNSNNQQKFIKRPLNAYMIWTVEQRQKIKIAPRQKMNEVSRAMGEVWKKMSDAEKAPYFDLAKKYAEEHKQALKDNPNLAYVPSKKKARISKNPEKDSISSRSSPDLSDIPESPAFNSRATSFAPMSPPIHPQQTLTRQVTLAPRISYYQPITTAGEGFDAQTLRLIPANRANIIQQPLQNGFIYEGNTYTLMTQPIANQFQAPALPRPTPIQIPAVTTTAVPPPAAPIATTTASTTPATSTAGDQLLSSNQIRERYYAALCQPQFPNIFESPTKLREANYYYDLHLQLHKKPL